MTSNVSNVNIFRLLFPFWKHLDSRRQKQFGLLLLLMLFSALAEVGTLGAVVPFLGVLGNPDVVFTYPIARELGGWIGVSSSKQMVLPLTLLFIGFAILSAALRLLLLWVSARLSNVVGVDIGYMVYLNTLYQPYETHLTQNSSLVINVITQKVAVSVHALTMVLNLCVSAVLVSTITVMLFVINPEIALWAALIFGGSYVLVGMIFRKMLTKNSDLIANNSSQLVQSIQEGIGGIRDVILDGTQTIYAENYRQVNLPLQLAHAKNLLFSGSPRYLMEAMGMVLIGGLAYMLSQQAGGMVEALPMLGALALAAQRMLPNLQQAYASWAGIAGCQASVKDTLDFLNQPLPDFALENRSLKPLSYKHSIQFDQVSFRYGQGNDYVLEGVSTNIDKGSRVGIVGSTGSGKSTLMDILMGLLNEVGGRICVDGKHIQSNAVKAFQKNIAHVPQSIFLSDGTIAENIAFGVPKTMIDMEEVKQAAGQAQLASFIDTLDLGYEALVGERGVRLSGGQKQRIGIARALYKQASIIIFDEATSALDNATEQLVMKSIDSLDSSLTIFLIAHRLSTVKNCDLILVLDKGHLVAQGTYEELLESSAEFRRIAN